MQPTFEPTQSAQPTTPPNGTDPYLIIGIVAAAVVAVTIVSLTVYSKKYKKTANLQDIPKGVLLGEPSCSSGRAISNTQLWLVKGTGHEKS
jgi:hypothetical protein